MFLGAGAAGADRLAFPERPNVAVRGFGWCSPGWRQKLHYGGYLSWVALWALWWRPGWIYASDVLACPAALVAAAVSRARVLYHEHDPPEESTESTSQGAHRSPWMRLALRCRRVLAKRADVCVLPNDERAQCFRRVVADSRPVQVVWNCPRRGEVGEPRTAKRDGRLLVYYHGSLNHSRLPFSVVEALVLLPDSVRLRIAGYETVGSRGYVRGLFEFARRQGVAGRVEFAGALPCRRDVLERCSECDVGLALMPREPRDPNLRWMVGASNKPFDYLARGLAVLVSDLPEWRRTFVDPGYGLSCDPEDPQSIASALRWFLEHPAELRAMGERGRRRILDDWNYEGWFRPVLRFLEAQ